VTRRHPALPLAVIALAALTCAVTGCRRGEPTSTVEITSTAAQELEVTGATLSLPTPMMGAAYFVVENPGATADRLLGIASDQAERAELHETIDDGGVMRMVPRPEGLDVPAGGRLELAPGGAHVMLVNPSPKDGAIELTLTFETHEPIVLRLAVPETQGDAGASDHDHMAHEGDGGQGS